MRHWSWILTAVAIVALVVLVIPLVYTQKKISLVQHELGSANEQILRGRAASAELEKVITNLKTELDAAGKLRSHLQTEVVDTNSKMEQLQKGFDSAQTENEALRDQLARMKRDADQAKLDSDKKIAAFKDQTETAIAKISQVAADRDTAQSKLAETQSQLESVESELEKVKVANAEAGKKLTELQSNLDQATAEVERLKSQQKNDASSQDSGAIAPPPIQ